LLAFARFLGSRFIALNFRWAESGLQLCLPNARLKRMQISQMVDVFSLRWRRCSWIELGWDGTVRAYCGGPDEVSLRAMNGPAQAPTPELETRVAAAVASGWSQFRGGDASGAERSLGQVPDAEVFLVPPSRSKGYLVWAGFMLLSLGIIIYAGSKIWGMTRTVEQARPFMDQVHNILAQEHEETAQINQLLQQSTGFIRKAQDLEQQARPAPPEQAFALRQQEQSLYQQNDQANAQMGQINRHMTQQRAEITRLQQEINQILHVPIPGRPAPTTAPKS